jgi:hypothetical protein
LISDEKSFVQHLKAPGGPNSEAQLVAIAKVLKSSAGGWRVQVCSQSQCGAEKSFNARLNAPASQVMSLRFTASSEQTAKDVDGMAAELRKALASAK